MYAIRSYYALGRQQGIGLAEVATADEAAVGGERTGVGGLV